MRFGKRGEMKWFELIVTLTLVMYPVLQIYAFVGGISLDIFIIGFLFFFYILKGGRFSVLPRPLFAYLVYSYLISAVSFNGIQSLIPLGVFLSATIMFVFWGTVRYEYLMKVYKYLAVFCVSFFFLQEFSYYTTGIRISGLIPFLPIAIADEQWKVSLEFVYRSSSVFSEPAHFAQFLLPLVCVEIFKKITTKSMVFLFFMVLALVLSLSGNAVFGLILIFTSYGIYTLIREKSFKRKVVFYIFVVIGFFSLGYFIQTEKGNDLMSRGEELSELSQTTAASSEYMRLLRGYDLYGEMPLHNKIFGIGDKYEFDQLIKHSRISYMFHENDTYLNGMAGVLVHCGIVGLILLFLLISQAWKGNNHVGKTLLALLILLMLISSTYFNSLFALLLIMAYGEKNYVVKPKKDETILHKHNNTYV